MEWCKNLQSIHRVKSVDNAQLQVNEYYKMGHDYKGLIPITVTEVSTKPVMMKTYDISVQNTEYFAIGNGLISHNSSEIALGPLDSEEFIDLKDYTKNPERGAFGWCSNNSIYGKIGMDYSGIAKRIANNGEPGIFWLDNARAYSRMGDAPDNKDSRSCGTNPCAEQTLESYELCCLCEVYIARHDTCEDFLRTLKFAYLYAKTVTLGDSHWVETNRVMMRNRRIGCSLTGIAQFLSVHNLDVLKTWCRAGYDEIQKWDKIYSEWLAVPRSIKTTSIKPSGCTLPSTRILVSDDPDAKHVQTMTMNEIFADCGVDLKKLAKEKISSTWFKPKMDIWVVNKNGQMEPVSQLYVNGIADCYEVPLDDGSVVTATAEHKFLVKRGEDDPQWIRTDELKIGDKIMSGKA